MSGSRALLLAAAVGGLLVLAAGGASLLAHERALSPEAARRWAVGAIRPPDARFRVAADGAEGLVARYGCLSCHTLDGAGADVGPALNGVRERKTRDELLLWLDDPQAIQPGTRMPDFDFNGTELQVLADWLLKR